MKLRIAILISAMTVMMGAYVNCTGVSQNVAFSNESTKASESQTDSGQPYDGKVYVVASDNCGDGIEIESRIIVTNSSKAQMDRHNCEYIAPVMLNSNEFQINPANPGQLTFQNQTFFEVAPLSQGLTNFVASGDASSVSYAFDYLGQPNFLQVLLDTDNSFATGYNYSGDIGADYLIENGTLYVYSGNGGAWGWTSVGVFNPIRVGQNIRWTIPRAAIGSPVMIKSKARTSLGYSSGVLSQ